MADTQVIRYHISKEQEGQYFTIPFTVAAATARLRIRYTYEKERPDQDGDWTRINKRNRIDLAVLAPDGRLVGSSGSNRTEIDISATSSTPGYQRMEPSAGTWAILVGAYVIVDEGADVVYEIEASPKQRRLYKGDLHTHTLASDGILTSYELGLHARRHGLDFVAITDHNTPCPPENLPRLDGLTFIPGLEWTHYRGHANFLGVSRPLTGSFHANTVEEVRSRFADAHGTGAVIVINHPFDPLYGFHFPMDGLNADMIEVWNGPMRESNLHAIGVWQQQLAAGQKIVACCGSDYHRDNLFQYLGGPCMGVYADSSSASDLLAALVQGHSFMVYGPDGPEVQLSVIQAITNDSLDCQAITNDVMACQASASAGWVSDDQVCDAIIGDTVRLSSPVDISVQARRLQKADQVLLITAAGVVASWTAGEQGRLDTTYRMQSSGFARLEIHRVFVPGLPALPALVSNPIFFVNA